MLWQIYSICAIDTRALCIGDTNYRYASLIVVLVLVLRLEERMQIEISFGSK